MSKQTRKNKGTKIGKIDEKGSKNVLKIIRKYLR